MPEKKSKLGDLIRDSLVRRHLAKFAKIQPQELPVPDDVTMSEGPFYTNRAMRRASGDRGYSAGLGAMAPSIKEKRGQR